MKMKVFKFVIKVVVIGVLCLVSFALLTSIKDTLVGSSPNASNDESRDDNTVSMDDTGTLHTTELTTIPTAELTTTQITELMTTELTTIPITEPTTVPVPTIDGVYLNDIKSWANSHGFKSLSSDEDWGYGQKMCSMFSNNRLQSIDIVYEKSTKQVITYAFYNTMSAATLQQQFEMIIDLSKKFSPQSDTEEIQNWINTNWSKNAKTQIGEKSCQLEKSNDGAMNYYYGMDQWSAWDSAVRK